MEEPYTLFTRECLRHAKEYGCPLAIFTWENRLDFRLSEPYDRIEQDVIRDADKIICGNKLAMRRMISVGADKDKLYVLLQSGIDTSLFKPMDEIERKYDIIYHGRMVREKGLYHLENVSRDLGVRLLTVGGRGTYHIKYGDAVDWTKYEDLPKLINQAKIGVQVPFSWQGYQEQGNFSIAENMSCGNPVIASNNGSIPDNFNGSPVTIINEGDEAALKEKIAWLLTNEELRLRKGEESRQWVINNLSTDVMGKRLIDILEVA
jgi:glycosyltransferase involved in cell wall biosynthesis